MLVNSQYVQKANRAKVLNFIRKNPNTSRQSVSQDTGLSMASMTNITSYLIDKKLITECGTEDVDRVGRKSVLLRFCHESYSLICVYIANGGIDFSYTDLKGNIINRICVKYDSSKDDILHITQKNIIEFIHQYKGKKIIAISISISGIILEDNQFVLSSTLKLKNIDLVSALETATGIPVYISNVSQLRAVWCFSCSDYIKNDNMIFIDLDGGIGACQYFDGKLNRAMLGEIGHTTVEKNGEKCFCGNKGCLEAMCSKDRIISLYKKYTNTEGTEVTFEDVAQKYYAGDSSAYAAVDDCAQYLGIAFANLLNLFKPSSIVINIGDFAPLRALIDAAKKVMCERAYSVLLRNLVIQEVNIGVDQMIEGSAHTACDRLFDAEHQTKTIELI